MLITLRNKLKVRYSWCYLHKSKINHYLIQPSVTIYTMKRLMSLPLAQFYKTLENNLVLINELKMFCKSYYTLIFSPIAQDMYLMG